MQLFLEWKWNRAIGPNIELLEKGLQNQFVRQDSLRKHLGQGRQGVLSEDDQGEDC